MIGKTLKITAVALILCVSSVYGLFEKVEYNSAFANALGRSVVAAPKGNAALTYNPAAMTGDEQISFSADYFVNMWMDNTFSASVIYPYLKRGLWFGSYLSLNANSYYTEWKADLSVARNFTENFAAGLKMKLMGYSLNFDYLGEEMENGRKAIFDIDAGMTLQPRKEIGFALTIENFIRPDLTTSGNDEYALPMRANFGISYLIRKGILVTTDVKMDVLSSADEFEPNVDFGAGAQIPIKDIFFARMGVRALNMMNSVELSAGFGVDFSARAIDLAVDYAFVYNSGFAAKYASHYLTISYKLPEEADESNLKEIERFKVKKRTPDFDKEDYYEL